jgi:hypothetical protein
MSLISYALRLWWVPHAVVGAKGVRVLLIKEKTLCSYAVNAQLLSHCGREELGQIPSRDVCVFTIS